MNRSIAPPIANIKHIATLPFEKIILKNGVPVYCIHSPIQPIVKIEFIFEAGKWYEEKNLVADFTNRIIREGTTKNDAASIANFFDFYGCNLESFASFNSAGFMLYSLSKNVGQVLPMIKELFTEAIFPEHEIKTIATNRKEKWKEQQTKNEHIANRIFLSNMWGISHPYGRVSEAAHFDAIQQNDLIAYFKSRYVSNNLMIIISGNIEESTITSIENLFGDKNWTNPNPHTPSHTQIASEQKVFHIDRPEMVQSTVLLGNSTITKYHPDYLQFTVANTLFGGFFGSRLMRNIREEKGYTYGIFSSINAYQHGGIFEISAEVGKEFCNDTIAEIANEINHLQLKKVSADELAIVQNYMAGRILRSVDGAMKYSDVLRGMIQYNAPETYLNDYLQIIYNTTPEDVLRLAQTYFDFEKMYKVSVG